MRVRALRVVTSRSLLVTLVGGIVLTLAFPNPARSQDSSLNAECRRHQVRGGELGDLAAPVLDGDASEEEARSALRILDREYIAWDPVADIGMVPARTDLRPGQFVSLMAAAVASWQLGDAARAQGYYSAAVLLAPECEETLEGFRRRYWAKAYNRGIRAYQNGDERQALRRFAHANRIRPDVRSVENEALLELRTTPDDTLRVLGLLAAVIALEEDPQEAEQTRDMAMQIASSALEPAARAFRHLYIQEFDTGLLVAKMRHAEAASTLLRHAVSLQRARDFVPAYGLYRLAEHLEFIDHRAYSGQVLVLRKMGLREMASESLARFPPSSSKRGLEGETALVRQAQARLDEIEDDARERRTDTRTRRAASRDTDPCAENPATALDALGAIAAMAAGRDARRVAQEVRARCEERADNTGTMDQITRSFQGLADELERENAAAQAKFDARLRQLNQEARRELERREAERRERERAAAERRRRQQGAARASMPTGGPVTDPVQEEHEQAEGEAERRRAEEAAQRQREEQRRQAEAERRRQAAEREQQEAARRQREAVERARREEAERRLAAEKAKLDAFLRNSRVMEFYVHSGCDGERGALAWQLEVEGYDSERVTGAWFNPNGYVVKPTWRPGGGIAHQSGARLAPSNMPLLKGRVRYSDGSASEYGPVVHERAESYSITYDTRRFGNSVPVRVHWEMEYLDGRRVRRTSQISARNGGVYTYQGELTSRTYRCGEQRIDIVPF